MLNVDLDSIGKPEPFQIRVFSTMNSSGVLAPYLMFGLTLLLASKQRFRWVAILLCIATLALTLVRTIWLGAGLSILLLAAFGGRRSRWGLAVVFLSALAVSPFVAVDPAVSDLLDQRISSLTQLSGDMSLEDRSAGLGSSFEELETSPFGEGLAIAGAFVKADSRNPRVIDGGPIQIFLSLGVIGGLIYNIAVVLLVGVAVFGGAGSSDETLISYRITALVLFLLTPSGTFTIGEIGLVLWLCVGVALASNREAANPPTARPSSKLERPAARDTSAHAI